MVAHLEAIGPGELTLESTCKDRENVFHMDVTNTSVTANRRNEFLETLEDHKYRTVIKNKFDLQYYPSFFLRQFYKII